MADNHISITIGTQRCAAKLRECVDYLERYRTMLADIKASMDQMTDGATFTTLEAQFGLSAGKGSIVYNLVTGSNAELAADTQFNQLLSWLAAIN